MKKPIVAFMFLPLALFSCAKSTINIPGSPFNDSYSRKGTTSQFNYKLDSLDQAEFSDLKDTTDKYFVDANGEISSYSRQQEDRDLKYAYFGKEISTISMCTLFSQKKTSTSYSNSINNKGPVRIDDLPSESQRQTSGGNIVDKTENIVYRHNLNETSSEYTETTEKHNNDQSVKITAIQMKYTGKKEVVFNVDLSSDIQQHFLPFDKKFTLLGENAIYGKTNINGVTTYIIKGAYSEYQDFSTNMGKKYKSVNNYFYEGSLEKKSFGFACTSFRFYKELLILSQSFEDEATMPVLYLDSPVLVQFSETSYQINYDAKQTYQGNIPLPNFI